MYVRGSDQNVEYKRPVDGFFRGIVINNEDPNSLMRVKAFIPELVNFNFIEEANVKGDTLKFGAPQMNTALDGPLVEKLKPLVPWAEQAAGLFGEAGSSHWNSPAQQQWTKTNYGNTTSKTSTFNFAKLNKRKAGWGKGRGSLMGREAQGDATANPTPGDVWTTKKHGLGSLNPSGFGYGPVNSGARASGVYGVPQVGSQVWIFHEQGNVNFPIYFAAIPAYKETAQVFRNGTGGGPFENGSGNTPTDPDDSSTGSGTAGEVNASGFRSTVYATAYEGGTPENPRGNGIPLDITTRWETDTSAEGAERRQRYNLRQIPVQWQFLGNANNQLVAGRSIAVDSQQIRVWPRGTILNINGREYEVADTAGRPGVIDFYAGNSRQMMNRFKNFNIETIEVVSLGS